MGAEGGAGDVEAAAPVAGGGVEPHPALGNLDFVDWVDAVGQAQDGADAAVLVTHLDAHAGDSPQIAVSVECDGLDVERAAVVVVMQPVEGLAVDEFAVLQEILPHGITTWRGLDDGDSGQVWVNDAGDGFAWSSVASSLPALVIAG